MITAARNQYYVCLGYEHEPIPWNPFDSNQKVNLHTNYFGKAFVAMEEALEREGWIVYLTWDLEHLPSYGDRVVAVTLGDEWCRIPRYVERVAANFKCYGIGPELGCNPFQHPSYQNLLTSIQYLNALARYSTGWVHRKYRLRKNGLINGNLPPIYDIPLGYANQVDLPVVPVLDRPVDVSFAGSVVHKPYGWWSLKQWFRTPKSYSRHRMITELQRVVAKEKSWQIDLKITPSYRSIRSADPIEYSKRVMNSKISIAPRGTSFETFRFFEALRAGCIVISEYLPDRWFYSDAPIVRIDDWCELDDVLRGLLADPEKLQFLHNESLKWWREKCSEVALGRFMASKLNA